MIEIKCHGAETADIKDLKPLQGKLKKLSDANYQKPIALAEWCFENYGNPKTVLDLFGGSGSTLIACEKTDRRCYMSEIDPHYCQVIIDRWENYTGKQAVKE